MTNGSIIMLAINMRGQFIGRETAEVAKEIAQVAIGAMKFFCHCVHLGAVAGRQHHDFADVGSRHQAMHGLGNCVVGNSDPLKKGQGPSTVIHPKDDDRHGSYLIP